MTNPTYCRMISGVPCPDPADFEKLFREHLGEITSIRIDGEAETRDVLDEVRRGMAELETGD